MKIRKVTIKDIPIIDDIYVKGAISEVKLQFPKKTKKEVLKEIKKNEKERISGFRKGIKSKSEYWIVAIENSQIVGFGQATINKEDNSKGEIEKVYIKEKFRGKKIGLRISKELVKWLKKKKVKEVIDKIFFKNKPSIKMHKRLGFETMGVGMHLRLR